MGDVTPQQSEPTQQVLTSRLASQSNSSGRQCLIRMHTHSSHPILVLPGSQVLPAPFVGLSVQGVIGGLLQGCRGVRRSVGHLVILE